MFVSLALIVNAGLINAQVARIVCTTTHLSSLAETLAGKTAQVDVIIPWSMCPGHFELKPGEIEKIRRADLILGHGMEKFLSPFGDNKKYPPISMISIPGNWMVPAVQKRAAERIAGILTDKFPQNAETFRANLAAYRKRIDALEAELKPFLKKLQGRPVLCSTMCVELAQWMGVKVIAEFARDENVSLQNMQNAVRKGRDGKARMIIENQQSSGKLGQTLAKELDVPLAVISNFPEPDSLGSPNYEATLKKNVRALNNCR
ncbi:MAG: metal ABC transporter substrate-binding protein [Verrucomicrobiota bacterium]